MDYQLSPPQWLQLPMAVRGKIAEVFNIPRSKGTIVVGNAVQSDGYTFEDLAHLTVDRMQNFLGSAETDFMSLFNSVVETIEASLEAEIHQDVEIFDPKDLMKKEWTATMFRIKGQAVEHNMDSDLADVIDTVFVKQITQPNVKTKKRSTSTKGTNKSTD